MMALKAESLYICPWSLDDPLCRSQSLAYIRGLVEAGYKFALITFETEKYQTKTADWGEKQRELRSEGIDWYPVNWPAGTSIFDKLKGIKSVIATGISVCRRHRPRLIHSRSSLPVFAAVTLSKLFHTKFLYDADSMLSKEYVDVGHVTRDSRAFKFLAWSEKWARMNADHIIVLTEKLRQVYLDKFGVTVKVDVIPCCVDTNVFRFDAEARERIRNDLGAGDDLLFVYVGKTGSWYVVDETFELFKAINTMHPASRMLIISREAEDVFHDIAERVGVGDDLYFVRTAEYSDIPKWLSAGDAGLSLIRQVKSKMGSSPVKFAEYLSIGLPVITTDGIGDCTTVVTTDNVGIVLGQLDGPGYDVSSRQILELLSEPREIMASRCSAAAKRRFSVRDVGVEKYTAIYKTLLK